MPQCQCYLTKVSHFKLYLRHCSEKKVKMRVWRREGVLLWESAWEALSPQTVHLAHCHTAAHAQTRQSSTLIGPHTHQSQTSCPDGHRDNGKAGTCMEWNGFQGEGNWGLEGLEERSRVVASSPPNMGGRLTGVKIEK